MANLFQVNLNRAWRAQDLMAQTVTEDDAILYLVSEPAGIPDSPRWFASENKLAAIYVGGGTDMRGLATLYRRGERCIAISVRKMIFVSCYVSPNVSLLEYRTFLDELTDIIVSAHGYNLLLAGDFNAHSLQWGSTSTSSKGELLEVWVASLDMRLVNIGDVPTCVRWQGSLVVDLTWVSPGLLGRIANWRVRNYLESLSDHRYVSFALENRIPLPRRKIHGLRWNWRKLDQNLLQESATWSCSVGPSLEKLDDPNPSHWMDRVLREVCDASALRVFARKPQKYVH